MATTEIAATAVKSADEVVEALREWVDKNLSSHVYGFTSLEEDAAMQAARRVASWAIIPFDNESLYEAFVAGTATAEEVEALKEGLVSSHEAFELFTQTIAIRFHPTATEITDAIREEAKKYAFHARL